MNLKNIGRILVITGLILLIPFISMKFNDQVVWTASDFAMAGLLLIGTSLMYELSVSKVNSRKHRVLIAIALFAALVLVWLHLAVGLF